MWKYLNKGIPTSIAIGIILILVVVVGSFTWLKYGEIWKKANELPEIELPEKEKTIILPEINLETMKLATLSEGYVFFENPRCIETYRDALGRPWCVECDYCIGDVIFSSTGKHVVYWKKNDTSESIILNDEEVKAYSDYKINYLAMSSNGESILYVLSKGRSGLPYTVMGEEKRVVINGEEGKLYNDILWPPIVSSDGKHFAYVVETLDEGEFKQRVIFDGEEGNLYMHINHIKLSPNGEHIAYWALVERRGKFPNYESKWSMVKDNKEGEHYSGHGDSEFVFSPNSIHFAYKAPTDKGNVVVFNNKKGPIYERIRNIIFSLDSNHFGYYAFKEGKWFLVIDNKEISEIDKSWPDNYDYSLIKKELGYSKYEPFVDTLKENEKFYVAYDNYKGELYDRIFNPSLSSDGKYITYGALLGNELWWIAEELE